MSVAQCPITYEIYVFSLDFGFLKNPYSVTDIKVFANICTIFTIFNMGKLIPSVVCNFVFVRARLAGKKLLILYAN